MILSKNEAIELLEKCGRDSQGIWVSHSKTVAEAARRIAKCAKLDEEKAYVLGIIHDIGKMFGPTEQHVIDGYTYLKEIGIDDEYANICLTHSYLNNDIDCTAGGVPDKNGKAYDFRKEFIKNHKYTVYEEIINLCDLMCTNKFMILEQRLVEIMTRRGVHSNTVYHINEAIKLKKKIDNMLGVNVYSLFPEIVADLNSYN